MRRSQVLHEITPLMDKDALYIADRHKKEFTYPIHNHEVFELNFVEHASGACRTVGDNRETIGEYDLVLITSPNLEHVWEQADCTSEDIHKSPFSSILAVRETRFLKKHPSTTSATCCLRHVKDYVSNCRR